ncbi:hypothetical protein L7F22_047674 [Adiantum nelumboides]|nr:hypothetical protein [Adiantum nelumboides]
MGESTGEPAEGAKEQSGSREQPSGQALVMEKVGDKRPTTALMEALGDAPKDLLSKFCKKGRLVRGAAQVPIAEPNKERLGTCVVEGVGALQPRSGGSGTEPDALQPKSGGSGTEPASTKLIELAKEVAIVTVPKIIEQGRHLATAPKVMVLDKQTTPLEVITGATNLEEPFRLLEGAEEQTLEGSLSPTSSHAVATSGPETSLGEGLQARVSSEKGNKATKGMLTMAMELQDCVEKMNLIANMQEQVKSTITRASASSNEWAKELQQHTNLQQQVSYLKRTVSWQGVHIQSLIEEQNQTKQVCDQLKEENKLYKEMEQEHISAIRKAVGKEEAAAKKIKELQATLQIGDE